MLGIVVAAIMAASFFMPWVEILGNGVGPITYLTKSDIQLSEVPWQGFAFLASFAIAALAAVVALMERAAGLLMLVAGAIPFGLIAQQVTDTRGLIHEYGLSTPQGRNADEMWEIVREFIEIGAPVYFLSAALLVVIGLARAVRGR